MESRIPFFKLHKGKGGSEEVRVGFFFPFRSYICFHVTPLVFFLPDSSYLDFTGQAGGVTGHGIEEHLGNRDAGNCFVGEGGGDDIEVHIPSAFYTMLFSTHFCLLPSTSFMILSLLQ